MYSWGGREKKLAQLPPEGEKAETASVEQTITTGVPPNTRA
jgi:hypothetical protein